LTHRQLILATELKLEYESLQNLQLNVLSNRKVYLKFRENKLYTVRIL